jgi:nucleoid DNA-binding protein
VNKRDVIKSVYNQLDLTSPEVESAVNTTLSTILLALACGEDVLLSGFGKFEVYDRKAVQRRDPRNGELVDVPAKRVVRFIPSATMKGRVDR